jgi:hypothetical protein
MMGGGGARLRAIKAYCRECAGGSYLEVLFCHLLDCPLHPYRTGYSEKENETSLAAALKKHQDVAKELLPLLAEWHSFPPRGRKSAMRMEKSGNPTYGTVVQKED